MQAIEPVKDQISSALRHKLVTEGLSGQLAVIVSCAGSLKANELASQLRAEGALVGRVLTLANAVAVELSPTVLIRTLTAYPQARAELDLPGELE